MQAILIVLLSGGFLAAGSVVGVAQDDSAAATTAGPVCVVVSEISGSEVVDASTIALELRSGAFLRVRVDNSCPQLAFHEVFTYRAIGGQLCAERDMVVARSGETCRIFSMTPMEAPTLPLDTTLDDKEPPE